MSGDAHSKMTTPEHECSAPQEREDSPATHNLLRTRSIAEEIKMRGRRYASTRGSVDIGKSGLLRCSLGDLPWTDGPHAVLLLCGHSAGTFGDIRIARPEIALVSTLLIVPTIRYAMGQSAGLYRLVALLPGFSSIRQPVHIWFVPSLGLALLGGGGVVAIAGKRPIRRWIPATVLLLFCADLFYHQSLGNSLAYARQSYEDHFGPKQDLFRKAVTAGLPPLTRFGSDAGWEMLSSFDHSTTIWLNAGR